MFDATGGGGSGLRGLAAAILLQVVVCLALLAVRILHSGRSTFDFLAWNLFLALIPLALSAVLVIPRRDPSLPVRTVLLVLWVLFFPNAPYILTDFVHLGPDPPIPVWFDVVLFASYAWTGLFVGFVALDLIDRAFLGRLGTLRRLAGLGALFLATGAAIYLGRVREVNSWDLLIRPGTVVDGLVFHGDAGTAAAMAVTIAAFLAGAYAGIAVLRARPQRT
jgi:uncharacterized membrane protein